MNNKSLDLYNIIPNIDEIKKFQIPLKISNEDEDLTPSKILKIVKINSIFLLGLANIQVVKRKKLEKGDTVKVIEGDLKHLMGIVESVGDDGKVNMKPIHEELHDILTFEAYQLQKYFKEGDHVKVIAGTHEGETGLIITVKEKTVIIFSDFTQKEVYNLKNFFKTYLL